MPESEPILYILKPGWIRSKKDGDSHYVGVKALASLYGVPRHRCLVRFGTGGAVPKNAVFLAPRRDGNYALPERNQASPMEDGA